MITEVTKSPESEAWLATDVDYENMKAHVQQRDGKWYVLVEIHHKNGYETLVVVEAVCDTVEEAKQQLPKLFPGLTLEDGVDTCDVYCGETEELLTCVDCGAKRCSEHIFVIDAEDGSDVDLCLPCLAKRERAKEAAAQS